MFHIGRIALVLLSTAVLGSGAAFAQAASEANGDVQLSAELTQLLRAEMRELLGGVQVLAVGIATGDWKAVADTGARISASYLLEQNLTAEQTQELSAVLPEHFRRLDAQFHLEAAKLEAAGRNRDAQLSAFHYYRLIETCTDCHSRYAPSRFPGLASPGEHPHGH